MKSISINYNIKLKLYKYYLYDKFLKNINLFHSFLFCVLLYIFQISHVLFLNQKNNIF